MSYAMARLKANSYYRSNDPRVHTWNRKDESALRKMLTDDRYRKLLAPGEPWWRHVQMFLAERDGDTERLAQFKAEEEALRRRLGLAPTAA